MRISDIAKQLGTKSNEVIRVLEEHGIDNNGKKFAPNSSVEEGVIEGLKSDIKIEKKQNTTEGKEEAHKQKIYMVSNPQNSQGFKPNRKNNNNQNQNKNNMNRPASNVQNNKNQTTASGKTQRNSNNNNFVKTNNFPAKGSNT